MADFTLTGNSFVYFLDRMGRSDYDLVNDVLKWAPVDNSIALTAETPDPTWGLGGTTNVSTAGLSGGNYLAGGITLAGQTWGVVGGAGSQKVALAANDQQVDVNVSNPSGVYHYVLYDDTHAAKPCIGFWSVPTPPLDLSTGNHKNYVFSAGVGSA